MTGGPTWLSAETIQQALGFPEAVAALRRALVAGVDPAAEPARSVVPVPAGQLLLMPSAGGATTGVKIVSVTPANAGRGLPRVQGLYVLFDAQTLTPLALLDGAAVTTLRTPAVSALAASYLADPAARRLVVFGSGPQARGHVAALRAAFGLTAVVVVSRNAGSAGRLVDEITASGLAAGTGRADAVGSADLIVCATSASEPLFPADLVPGSACVIAVGSHDPDRRELDPDLLRRAGLVVVEDRRTALREDGNIVGAVAAGAIEPAAVVGLADLVTGRRGPPVTTGADRRPAVFTSVGMAWEDLVIVTEIHRRAGLTPPDQPDQPGPRAAAR